MADSSSTAPNVTMVGQPHPEWQPGEKMPHPFPDNEMIELDPSELGAKMYPFMISSVVPRPIAFICSVSKEGVRNLSPYSYFNVMSHDPPVVCIGCCPTASVPGKRDLPMKDSHKNIMETKEFTLNMISEWFVEAMNHTCGNYDPQVDEVQLSGFTPLPSSRVKPPRLQESVVQFECKLRDTHEVANKEGKVTSTIIIAEVVMVHVNKHVTSRTKNYSVIVDLLKYAPVSRCGGDIYARVTEAYDIPRPGKEWQDRRNESS